MSLPSNPITRNEQYLSNIAGEATQIPSEPHTREEQYLDFIAKNGGGGGTGEGDMKKSVYDSDLGVASAGGIKAYVTSAISDKVSTSATAGLLKNDGTVDTTAYIPTSQKGEANGVASLDANGNVPIAQIPITVNAGSQLAMETMVKIYIGSSLYHIPQAEVEEIASYFMEPVEYSVGDYVVYSHRLFRCTTAHTGDWDSNDFTQVTLGGEVTALNLDAYKVSDTAETDLADGDYVPFYDTSATAKRKTLWSNIKAKLKTYFDTLYCAIGLVPSGASPSNKMATASDVASRVDWSSYAKTGVHNWLNNTYKTTTLSNDVTITVFDDGTFELNGNSNAVAAFYMASESYVEADTYIFSAGLNGASSPDGSKAFLFLSIDGLNDWICNSGDTEANRTFTPSDITKPVRMGIKIESGKSFDHLKFYPLIRSANDTNKAYAPHAMTNRELTERLAIKSYTLSAGENITINSQKARMIGNVLYLDVRFTPSANVTAWTSIISADISASDLPISVTENTISMSNVGITDGSTPSRYQMAYYRQSNKFVIQNTSALSSGTVYNLNITFPIID